MTGIWPWGAHIDGCTVDLCNGRFKSDKQDRVKVNGAVIETRSDRPMLSLGWTVSHCNLPAPLNLSHVRPSATLLDALGTHQSFPHRH